MGFSKSTYFGACLRIENNTGFAVLDLPETWKETLMPINGAMGQEGNVYYFVPNITDDIWQYGVYDDQPDEERASEFPDPTLFGRWIARLEADEGEQIEIIKKHFGNGDVILALVAGVG